jgi:hypothetical protein
VKHVKAILRGAVIVGSLCAVNAYADDSQPSNQQLLDEVRALRARVDELQRAQDLRKDRVEMRKETDATVGAVLKDADRRSQLLEPQGFTAGYDRGAFVIRSENGDFSFSPHLRLQARYVANHRDENAVNAIDGTPQTEHGFEISRLRLIFDGNLFGPNTEYHFQWNTSTNGGGLVLEEAYIQHKLELAPDVAVKGGQYRDPTFHEEITDDFKQLAVDRSLANEVLGGGQTRFIQGVSIIWDDGPEGLPIRGEAGVTDGPNSANTNFVDGGGSPGIGVASPDFGLYARGEYLVMGDWRHYDDFTAKGNPQDTMVFGAGMFYAQAGDNDALMHTFDVQYEYNLLGLYAAYYGVYSDTSAGGSNYDLGLVAQAGYMLSKRWEVFGRYSLVSLDSGSSGSKDANFHELTGGLNWYLKTHSAKLTVDATWLPNGVPSNQPQIGELDPDGDDNQILFRGQFQLML